MAKEETPAEEHLIVVYAPASGITNNRVYMAALETLAGENKSTTRVHQVPTFYSVGAGAVAFFHPLLQPPVLVVGAKTSGIDESVRRVFAATCKEMKDEHPPYNPLKIFPDEREVPAFLEFMRELMKTENPYGTAVLLETAYASNNFSVSGLKKASGVKGGIAKFIKGYLDLRRIDELHKGKKSRKNRH